MGTGYSYQSNYRGCTAAFDWLLLNIVLTVDCGDLGDEFDQTLLVDMTF